MKTTAMRRWALATAFVALMAASETRSHAALIFQFSFTNTIGNVAGTATGRILGLQDNSTGAASHVYIDSFPAGLDSIAGPTPIDATAWDQQFENSFTVLNGQVVAGGFWAQQTISSFTQGFQLYINGDGGPYNFLNLDGDDTRYVWGANGLDAANITLAVPEPSSFALAALGAVGLGAFRLRRRGR